MERVHFQQEQMIPELKDLVEKGLFTKEETRSILKKRTQFESALVRRVAKKSDFLRYLEYEMGLEALRRRRLQRLKVQPKSSISDYALVRRQFHVFERALKRFKSDIGLWVQYIQLAQREGAHTLASRVTARAIQLHPTVGSLYVLAAELEMERGSPSAARSMLQRGTRVCRGKDGVEVWIGWVRMEMRFVEALRRRWNVLGLEDGGQGTAAEMPMEEREHVGPETEHAAEAVGAELAHDSSRQARAAILNGEIVRGVIDSAVEAVTTTEMFEMLIEATRETNDASSPIAGRLLEQVYELLRTKRPCDPTTLRLLGDRFLQILDTLEGEDLVDQLQKTNESLLELCGQSSFPKRSEAPTEKLLDQYGHFADTVWARLIDDSLKMYMSASVLRLLKQHPESPSLASTYAKMQ
ncbi:unnamed protein product [Mycena citricolor]|uniref:U3 small nucleolar RNA-associated protein 6 N-terminal domain-containing protein n=1 Tax=Mycena citricolor TaxID=2018698 RepID=A0AAD2JXI0_9AGAR|nr:unnamed protein product [Mycena citricolor]